MSQQARSLMNISIPVAPGAVTEYRAVDFTGAQATTQGQKVMGVANRSAAIGEGYDVTTIGSAVVEAGGAFAAGASLIVDNQGRAIASTGKLAIAAGATAVTSAAANGVTTLTGGDSPEWVFADAVQASTGAGDKVEVLLRR